MNLIDDYFEKVVGPQKAELRRVRAVIGGVIPQADETISYGMPAFKINGKYIIAFGAFKNHMSLFPGANPFADLEQRLAGYKRSKGTIQFTLNNTIPDDLLKDIVLSCLDRSSDS